jgi:hypothetical protein
LALFRARQTRKSTLIKAVGTVYEASIRRKEDVALQAGGTIIRRNPAFAAWLQARVAYSSTCIVSII